jgi:hypothetical protein
VSGVEKAPFPKKTQTSFIFHISGFSENRKKIVARLPTFFFGAQDVFETLPNL